MGKSLGGAIFVWNGISQDYSFRESIRCLLELCDEVSVVYGGSDGTEEAVEELLLTKTGNCNIVNLTTIDQDTWDAHQGREKISYFMNEAIRRLKTDYVFSLQADEIIYERSFQNIRDAIEIGAESIVAVRYNIWRDPLSMLNVEQSRKPCSTEVIRLAKQKYRAYNDGEHLAVDSVSTFKSLDAIEIYHCGFIRDPIKMVTKCRNMLVDIFNVGMDERIGEKFDYRNFPFEGNDIVPVPGPLPKFIQQWAKERYPEIDL